MIVITYNNIILNGRQQPWYAQLMIQFRSEHSTLPYYETSAIYRYRKLQRISQIVRIFNLEKQHTMTNRFLVRFVQLQKNCFLFLCRRFVHKIKIIVDIIPVFYFDGQVCTVRPRPLNRNHISLKVYCVFVLARRKNIFHIQSTSKYKICLFVCSSSI